MSAELVRSPAPPSGAATPRSKLDSLSREDLIRFVKKQVENLKLLKAENAKLIEENTLSSRAFQDAEEKWKKKLDEAEIESIRNVEEILRLTEECKSLSSKNVDLCAEVTRLESALAQIKMSSEEEHLEGTQVTQQPSTCSADSVKEEERLKDELNALNGTVEEQRREMKALKDLFRDQTEKLVRAEKRNEELQCTVDELRSSLDDINEQLNAVKEKRNAENVFSLELADYERSLDKVQKELKMTKEECASLNSELEKARTEADGLRDEKARISTNFHKMKTAVVKLKAELGEKKDLISELEAEKKALYEKIEVENKERNEEKIEFSAVIGTAEEKIRQLESSCSSLNRQLVSLRSQRESLQRQYDDLVQEHTTFKTRALYVLEQKKGDQEHPREDDIEVLEHTIEQQKKTIENLKQFHRVAHEELCAAREHSLALTAQLQNVEHQLSAVNDAHKKSISEQRNQFESRLAAETKLNSELLAQIDANFIAHAREKERIMNEAKRERDSLIAELEIVKRALDDESRKRKEAERNRSPANIAVPLRHKQNGVTEVTSSFLRRPQPVEEQCENTEESESERTLEEVLYGEDSDMAISAIREEWQSISEFKNWEQIALNTQRQLQHTRELLNESEASNVRLSEQSKLLKEEIRRLERNEQRTDHVANSEYLKNVILKFIAPEKVSSERGQLVHVLATMLKLSNEEIELLNKVAQADTVSKEVKSAGWSSYLHRWSGLS
uniref:GRIP domain-containing protein n=1 Tax=Parascaris univalens TaxID=6257 RepID=A0A914ZD47_PARUN